VTEITGLLLDPYFSGTKLAWLLDHVRGARARPRPGSCWPAPSTAWVIWKLTGGRSTPPTPPTPRAPCSTTSAAGPGRRRWARCCRSAGRDAAGARLRRGLRRDRSGASWAGRIPIRGVAGRPAGGADGAGLHPPGEMKATYGTGLLHAANTGARRRRSRRRGC
jgi:glycerol kinase